MKMYLNQQTVNSALQKCTWKSAKQSTIFSHSAPILSFSILQSICALPLLIFLLHLFFLSFPRLFPFAFLQPGLFPQVLHFVVSVLSSRKDAESVTVSKALTKCRYTFTFSAPELPQPSVQYVKSNTGAYALLPFFNSQSLCRKDKEEDFTLKLVISLAVLLCSSQISFSFFLQSKSHSQVGLKSSTKQKVCLLPLCIVPLKNNYFSGCFYFFSPRTMISFWKVRILPKTRYLGIFVYFASTIAKLKWEKKSLK